MMIDVSEETPAPVRSLCNTHYQPPSSTDDRPGQNDCAIEWGTRQFHQCDSVELALTSQLAVFSVSGRLPSVLLVLHPARSNGASCVSNGILVDPTRSLNTGTLDDLANGRSDVGSNGPGKNGPMGLHHRESVGVHSTLWVGNEVKYVVERMQLCCEMAPVCIYHGRMPCQSTSVPSTAFIRTVIKGRYSSSWGGGIPPQSYGTSLAIWDHTVLPATRHK